MDPFSFAILPFSFDHLKAIGKECWHELKYIEAFSVERLMNCSSHDSFILSVVSEESFVLLECSNGNIIE